MFIVVPIIVPNSQSSGFFWGPGPACSGVSISFTSKCTLFNFVSKFFVAVSADFALGWMILRVLEIALRIFPTPHGRNPRALSADWTEDELPAFAAFVIFLNFLIFFLALFHSSHTFFMNF